MLGTIQLPTLPRGSANQRVNRRAALITETSARVDMQQETAGIGSVRLTAVGDVMLGDSAICTGYGFASRYSDAGATDMIAGPSELFGSADVVFGNLECTLSQRRHDPQSWISTQLRAHPESAGALRKVGFNIMNIANNHASQHGDDAFADTVAHLRNAGIECCGIRGTDGWTSEPALLSVNGVRLGFLGYCLRPRQYSPDVPPYAEGTTEGMTRDIRRLSEDVDHVITSLHWGEEYVSLPSVSEIDVAHSLVDAGCSVIIGHHPHVHRPIERHGGAVIAYSLGNFMSDMIWYPPLRSPSVLYLELSDVVGQVTAERLWVSDTYLPIRCSPPEMVCIEEHVNGLEESAYQHEIARTIGASRIGSYAYAARNAHRFRFPTLLQLLSVTARNKLASLQEYIRRK